MVDHGERTEGAHGATAGAHSRLVQNGCFQGHPIAKMVAHAAYCPIDTRKTDVVSGIALLVP